MIAGTADRIVGEAHRLIVTHGFNGFSYADIAATIGIRKASIHHHFATKGDLAVAVVERSRTLIQSQVDALAAAEPDAVEQLSGYIHYWERCIADDSAPFCVAAMLAAELPSLPHDVAAAVTAHFLTLHDWLTRIFELGVRQGRLTLNGASEDEADAFLSAVHGAMLTARAFGQPGRFASVMDAMLARLLA